MSFSYKNLALLSLLAAGLTVTSGCGKDSDNKKNDSAAAPADQALAGDTSAQNAGFEAKLSCNVQKNKGRRDISVNVDGLLWVSASPQLTNVDYEINSRQAGPFHVSEQDALYVGQATGSEIGLEGEAASLNLDKFEIKTKTGTAYLLLADLPSEEPRRNWSRGRWMRGRPGSTATRITAYWLDDASSVAVPANCSVSKAPRQRDAQGAEQDQSLQLNSKGNPSAVQ